MEGGGIPSMLSARFFGSVHTFVLSRSHIWSNGGKREYEGRLAGWQAVTSSEPGFWYIPDRNLDAEVHERHKSGGWMKERAPMLVLGPERTSFFSDLVIRTDTGPQPPWQAASQPPPLSVLTTATSGKRHCNTTTKSKVPGGEGRKASSWSSICDGRVACVGL
jgi:hypothetical protein